MQECDAETMLAQILSVVNEIKPQILLSFGPDGLSGHPDHIAVGQWTAEAFQRVDDIAALYTVAVPLSLAQKLGMRQIHSVPDEAIALTVDVSSVWETKLAAMRCHATQLNSSPMISAQEERQRRLFGQEDFVRATSRDPNLSFMADVLKDKIV